MNAFVASRVGAALVLLSPVLFVVMLYTAPAHDAFSVVAQLWFYYAYLAAVASLLPLRPLIGGQPWLIWIVVCAAAALPAAVMRIVVHAAGPEPPAPGDAAFNALLAAVLTIAIVLVQLAGRRFDRRAAVDVAFPLSGGTYDAIQAGSTRLLNHHMMSRAQHFGLDIVKVADRAFGFAPPRALGDLPSYGVAVRSALDGTVVSTVDTFEDNPVGVRDVRHPFGNHVVVEDAGGTRVFFAHLKRSSVAVGRGQSVRTGDLLGLVGNSGNTTEPHLHIHAERSGVGLPLTFGGRFLIRNSSIRTA